MTNHIDMLRVGGVVQELSHGCSRKISHAPRCFDSNHNLVVLILQGVMLENSGRDQKTWSSLDLRMINFTCYVHIAA